MTRAWRAQVREVRRGREIGSRTIGSRRGQGSRLQYQGTTRVVEAGAAYLR